ncbi:MAG: xylulokinase [Anaerolineae bacterium]|nr:xylulokinase [Anaerolineae bacterium]
MTRLLLAHDLGTTGDKATLFDTEGRLVASAFGGYDVYHPQPTWAEQDPADWWRAVRDTTRRLLAAPGVAARDIAAISFSGHMMGCLPVDAAGRPLYRCLIWADQRAEAQANRVAAAVGTERVYRITGHRIGPTYSVAKILWLRDHQPAVFAATHKFLHVKDYIAHRMTGVFATDPSDASGMCLYDLDAGQWSAEILDAAGLTEARLPTIRASTDVIGGVTRAAADELGLAVGTPVVIGGGDGATATVGATAVREGIAYNYIGTSSWIAYASRSPVYDPAQRVFNMAHMVPGMYIPCGAMQAAGGSYQWLRRQVAWSEEAEALEAGEDVYEVMNRRAAASVPGAHGLLFLPYLQGERSPHWDPRARGGWIGLQVTHTRADLMRAVLEGVTFNLRSILDVFLAAGATIDEMLVIGGGAQGQLWRQIMADIYGRPVLRPRLLHEAASLGAAVAAGIGVGLFRDFDVVNDMVEIVDRQLPDPAARTTYERLYPTFAAAYERLVPVFHELSTLA